MSIETRHYSYYSPSARGNGSATSGVTPKLALPGMGGVPGSLSDVRPTSSAAPPSSSSSSAVPIVKKRSRVGADAVDSEEEDVDPETIRNIAKKAKAKPAAKRKKSKFNDDGTEKEKKPPNPNNPFNRPLILSDEMSHVCGGKEVRRKRPLNLVAYIARSLMFFTWPADATIYDH